jgi:ABC-type sugar transport system ATPase subunit
MPAGANVSAGDVAIEADHVTKSFGHVQALRDASLKVRRGEVVALVGDNGAGKSTLMKIMAGALVADGGEIRVGGHQVAFQSVRDAQGLGVEAVYQDLSLAPHLTVPESIFLGHEPVVGWRRLGVMDRRLMEREARDALELLGIQLARVNVRISGLSGGQRQAVAVARAAKWAQSVILLDEPTAALGVKQAQIVTTAVRTIAESGLAVLMISHDMPRMLETADRFVVMRLGETVANLPAANLTIPEIVAEMLGVSAVSGSARHAN